MKLTLREFFQHHDEEIIVTLPDGTVIHGINRGERESVDGNNHNGFCFQISEPAFGYSTGTRVNVRFDEVQSVDLVDKSA